MTDLPEKPENAATAAVAEGTRWRFAPALLIVAASLAYYGSYWRYWFNPHDEGGTVCLVAQRLLAGERPWVDVDPGYNIGWFYPVVWLFHFTGVSYLAARAWFFLLATVTALLGCAIVTRVSGSRWAGLAIGLLLVALPGSQFKDYIPLAEAANLACLIFCTRSVPSSRGKWVSVLGSGIVLGLTYLVRVEIGIFFSVIWLGVFVFLLLDRRIAAIGRRAICALAGAALLVGGVLIPQAPAYFACRSMGVDSQFLGVYATWVGFFQHTISGIMNASPKAQPPAAQISADAPATTAASPAPAPSPPDSLSSSAVSAMLETTDSSTLHRAPLSGAWRATGRNRLLPILTYAPLAGFAAFFLLGIAGLARELWRRGFTLAGAPMQWLLLLGGSLTTFPQFFLFRPDRPHLSEFMPGFIIAMAGCVLLLWPRGVSPHPARRVVAAAFAGCLCLHLLLFSIFAFEHPSAGTISARKGRKTRFVAENGINVFVSKREAQILTGVRDAVLKNSSSNDYLVCFPYMPGYNLMTNRRTYFRNVYVDNATRSGNWSEETIRDLETKRPAVVVVDDRKINGLDASRFSRWAARTYNYLKEHYTRAGRFDDGKIEVFALRAPVSSDSLDTPSVP